MAVFLLNQVLDESLLKKEEFFILLHAEDNNNGLNFPHRKYARFDLDLLGKKKKFVCVLKQNVIRLCHHVPGLPGTLKNIKSSHCFTVRHLPYYLGS